LNILILSRVRGSVTNNNRFWIGWLDLLALLLQLQSTITAHNQRLPKTRSVPYWTTSVFSSTVTDSVLIYELITYESLRANDEWIMRNQSPLNSLEPNISNSWSITASCPLLRNVCQSRGDALISTRVFVAEGTCLRNPYLAMVILVTILFITFISKISIRFELWYDRNSNIQNMLMREHSIRRRAFSPRRKWRHNTDMNLGKVHEDCCVRRIVLALHSTVRAINKSCRFSPGILCMGD
jgi:hypothetical protein